MYYVSLGGFDTHQNQKGRHENLMTQLAQGVGAFWADLKAQKNDERAQGFSAKLVELDGRKVEQFTLTEAGGSALLLAATVLALAWANSPWSAAYDAFWTTPASIGIGDLAPLLARIRRNTSASTLT